MAEEALSRTHTTLASFARPANTDTYTAGDVVCNAATLIFPSGAPTGSSVLNHALITSSSNPTLKLDGELWLFSATVAAVADNAAFAPTDAELLTLVTVVPFAVGNWKAGLSGADGAGNSMCEITGLGIPVTARALYGQLVTRNAYVPISAEALQIRLGFID